MAKYQVEVETEIGACFEIEAENEKDAKEQAEKMFNEIPINDAVYVGDVLKTYVERKNDNGKI